MSEHDSFVTPNTATSSRQRLSEIRARLEVAQDYRVEWPDHNPGTLAEFIAHAPADIAWLLEQVDELTKRVRMYEVVKS